MSTTQIIPSFLKSMSGLAKDNQASSKAFNQKKAAKAKRAKQITKERNAIAKALVKNQLKEQTQLKKLEVIAEKEAAKQFIIDEFGWRFSDGGPLDDISEGNPDPDEPLSPTPSAFPIHGFSLLGALLGVFLLGFSRKKILKW